MVLYRSLSNYELGEGGRPQKLRRTRSEPSFIPQGIESIRPLEDLGVLTQEAGDKEFPSDMTTSRFWALMYYQRLYQIYVRAREVERQVPRPRPSMSRVKFQMAIPARYKKKKD